jgi:hypothetical protein
MECKQKNMVEMLEISSELIVERVVDKCCHHQVQKDLPSTHVIQLAQVE